MATYLVANFLIRWDKKWKEFYLNFLWHFHWQNWRKSGTKKTKDFFCDISSGKIYENLGLKSKRIFLWHFQWRKSRTSRTTTGKDFFWIFCDISSGKILSNLGQKVKRIFPNYLWHFQWLFSRDVTEKADFLWQKSVQILSISG